MEAEGIVQANKTGLVSDGATFLRQIPLITTVLGQNVNIIPIRPLFFEFHGSKYPEHDFNVMYKIKFAGRSILLTGDVSTQLFSHLLNNKLYNAELKDNIDFLILPHHGSNSYGDFLIF